MKKHNNYESTHSAEPSPQLWLGNMSDYWQDNNCRLYLTVIMITILRL